VGYGHPLAEYRLALDNIIPHIFFPATHTPAPTLFDGAMSHVARLLAKHNFQFFTYYYAASHRSFIGHRLQDDTQHPLHTAQTRLFLERKKEGLWWSITVSVTLCKAKVVRTWVRRRLHTAFVEELRARGIQQDGRLVKYKPGTIRGHEVDARILDQLGGASLRGTVRLHADPLVITAKYADIRLEAGAFVDALLQGLKRELGIPSGNFKKQRPQRPQNWTAPQKARVQKTKGAQNVGGVVQVT